MAEEGITKSNFKQVLGNAFSVRPAMTFPFFFLLAIHILDFSFGHSGVWSRGAIPLFLFFFMYFSMGLFIGLLIPAAGAKQKFLNVAIWLGLCLGLGLALPILVPFFFDKVGLQNTDIGGFLGSLLLIPILPLFFFAQFSGSIQKFISGLFYLYIIFVIVNLMVFNATSIKLITKLDDVPSSSRLMRERVDIFITNFRQGATKIQDEVELAAKKQLALATGDIYIGEVDQKAQVKLGVYLEEIKLTQQDFYTDQKVNVFAKLVAQTLDDAIDVKLSCYGKNPGSNDKLAVKPDLYPGENVSVATYESQDVDCQFPANSFKDGTAIITLGAQFPFKTNSYIKTYFMDQSRLREMRQGNADPLDVYQITDKNPQAVYTNGPIKIGMGVGTPPVGIDQSRDETIFTLGVTIENAWKGKIKNISNIVIFVPVGFTLEDVSGEVSTPQESTCEAVGETEETCNSEIYNIYTLQPKIREAIDSFISFRVRVKASQADYNLLLGTSPISTRFFKTTVEYDYYFESAISVNIKKVKTGESGAEAIGPAEAATEPTLQSKKLGDTYTLNISYTTNKRTIDVLKLFKVAGLEFIGEFPKLAADRPLTMQHTIELTNLKANTLYKYELWATDTSGKAVKISEKIKTVSFKIDSEGNLVSDTANSPSEDAGAEIISPEQEAIYRATEQSLKGTVTEKSGPIEFILEYETDRPTKDKIIVSHAASNYNKIKEDTEYIKKHKFLFTNKPEDLIKLLGDTEYNYQIVSKDNYAHIVILKQDKITTLREGASA